MHATTNTPIALRFPGQWFQSESGLHQNWMRDYDPTTGRYIQADPLGLVDGASVYGYARQNPGRYTDPTGQCPMCVIAGAAAVGALIGGAWDVADQLSENGGNWECINWWQATRSGLFGAATGAMLAPAAPGIAAYLGASRFAGMAVNGLRARASWGIGSGMVRTFSATSQRLRAFNGLKGSPLQLHHWAFAQSWRISQWANGTRLGATIMNSRYFLNPIPGGMNRAIGSRLFGYRNILFGVPGFAQFVLGASAMGAATYGGEAMSDTTGCGCAN